MTNHFAALGIEESLLPDDELLRDRFYEASARFHPDAAEANEATFLTIKEAHTILRDPARRLFHLLELHHRKPAETHTAPNAVTDLFFKTNTILHSSAETWKVYHIAAHPLQKALLLDSLLAAGENLDGLLGVLQDAINANASQLPALEKSWPDFDEDQWSQLTEIAKSLAYLTKWKSEALQHQTNIAESTSGAIL